MKNKIIQTYGEDLRKMTREVLEKAELGRMIPKDAYIGIKPNLVVANPPYGERIMEKSEAEALYRDFGAAWRATENWRLNLLSSHTEFERAFGKTADKRRKLYNGMIKCDLFMYR